MRQRFLYAPELYWKLSHEQRRELTNGCGARSALVDLVPDSILGVSIHVACDIHDYMYSTGCTLADKQEADRVFRNNMIRLVLAERKKWYQPGFIYARLKKRRLTLAEMYYQVVHKFGGPAFWEDKNKVENLGPVDYSPVAV